MAKKFPICLVQLKNNTIQDLDLTIADILGDDGIELLAQALSENTSLQCLHLGYNGIGDKGMIYLSAALLQNKENTALQRLVLNGNKFGALGVECLTKALLENKTLQNLYLSGNTTGPIGSKNISNLLLKNTYIQVLDLDYNAIGDEGAEYLAKALLKNTTLEKLYLNLNGIGKKGKLALCSALKKNPSLHVIEGISLNRADTNFNSVTLKNWRRDIQSRRKKVQGVLSRMIRDVNLILVIFRFESAIIF